MSLGSSTWFKEIFPEEESQFCEIIEPNFVTPVLISDTVSEDDISIKKRKIMQQDRGSEEDNNIILELGNAKCLLLNKITEENTEKMPEFEGNNERNGESLKENESQIPSSDIFADLSTSGTELKSHPQDQVSNFNFSTNDNMNSSMAAGSVQVKKSKCQRNSGQEYVSVKTGKTISKRTSKDLPLCRLKCKEKITTEERLNLFKDYWSGGTYLFRMSYMHRLISAQLKQRATNLSSPKRNRNFAFKYKVLVDQRPIQVCKSCLMSIFGETSGFLKTVQDKLINKKTLEDQRGKENAQTHKMKPERLEAAKKHIESFPAYVSHYGRSHSSKKYLAENLNLSKMYVLYKSSTDYPLCYGKYREIFKSLNLTFKKPQIDTCSKCDKLAMAIKVATTEESKNQLIEERDEHHRCANLAYEVKRSDKDNPEKTVLCMDLQQCLPNPYLTSSVAFYKRSLWTFNFTIRDCSNKKTYCFTWDETVSGRGANEIASCIWRFFHTAPNIKNHVVVYSDTCAGQNRNTIITAMFILLINRDSLNIDFIEQKFLEPGHTHLECDNDHSLIERKKKNSKLEIYHPHDWEQLIRTCGRKSTKFEVLSMKRTDFFNFSATFKNLFKKSQKDVNGEKVGWRKIRILQYNKNSTTYSYKTNYEGESANVKCLKKASITSNDIKNFVPAILHSVSNAISLQKKKDLMDLLQFIPPIFHDFYKNLKTENDLADVIYDVNDTSEDY